MFDQGHNLSEKRKEKKESKQLAIHAKNKDVNAKDVTGRARSLLAAEPEQKQIFVDGKSAGPASVDP